MIEEKLTGVVVRCQAFALTGNENATDPTCEFSPYRKVLDEPLAKVGQKDIPEFIYRKIECKKTFNWNRS